MKTDFPAIKGAQGKPGYAYILQNHPELQSDVVVTARLLQLRQAEDCGHPVEYLEVLLNQRLWQILEDE